MRILDFYIARVVIGGTLGALAVLTALDTIFALIDEFEDVGKGAYGHIDALFYMAMTMPGRVYELFPAAVLVGSLLSLGAMAGNSELIVMRAAGVSVKRIVRSAVQAGLVLMILVAVIGEFMLPVAERYAQSLQSRKQGLQVSQVLGGFWVRDASQFVRIGKLYPNLNLQDVHIHRLADDTGLESVTYAASAIQREGYWELRDVYRTRFDGQHIRQEVQGIERWPTVLNPKIFDILSVDVDMMSASEIYGYVDYLERNNLDAATYRLAFWLKVITPLSCIVMMLVVLPFVFGALRSVSAGQLLVVGILLGLSFYILIQIASRVGQIYGVPPFISASFPVLCFAAIGLIGLGKVK